ncbi:Ni2+-binding GTPase [Paenibacillus sp. MER TA 81-3]|uniref:Ni2+-binding GTPase n=1 Tax=Paenibacillus sp. MER TA 81-3 TaxID=2939573 RepID=UPI00203DAB67|nr:Ni2+-binding GTPase [Paenibacillus sp. MER TA 81-3]MCM3338357.1 Ni2+-binding GTPase [Paenibacillus sp. MER TA 81-3]
MNEAKLNEYIRRKAEILPTADEAASTLVAELLAEMEQLMKDNERLRKSLHAAGKGKSRAGMSTKLKDALYE